MLSRSKKSTATPQFGRFELLEALDRQRAAIDQRDRELLTEQLGLEGRNVIPMPPTAAPDLRRDAAAMINGFAPAASSAEPEGARLFAIIHERAAIQIALDMMVQSEIRNRGVAVATVMQERGEDWRQIQRRRALSLVELRRCNAAAADFRTGVVAISGWPAGLLCDRMTGVVFGPQIVNDEIYTFLRDCVAAGIIDRGEIDAD